MTGTAQARIAQTLIANVLDIPVDKLAAETVMADIPAWDSIGHVRIILAIEERLGRTLTSAEIASITGVATVAAIIG